MAGESKPSGRARIYRQVGPYLGLGVEPYCPCLVLHGGGVVARCAV